MQAQLKHRSLTWRQDCGKIKQHVEAMKLVYYEIWRQREQLARSGICCSSTLNLVSI